MIMQSRIVSTLALAAMGCVALGALFARPRAHKEKKDVEHALNTWEGEGGSAADGPAVPGGTVPARQ
jgi:cell division septation protein DedD